MDGTKDSSAPRQGHRLIPSLVSSQPVLGDEFDTRAGLNVVEQSVEAFGSSLTATYRPERELHAQEYPRLSRR